MTDDGTTQHALPTAGLADNNDRTGRWIGGLDDSIVRGFWRMLLRRLALSMHILLHSSLFSSSDRQCALQQPLQKHIQPTIAAH
mmetsp:Transcript_15052/g.40401  ORF Transcript_15052/g.40401 Transcript_15052/m.40401 type:complete len:84 (-) Transcript_15052:5097-5348(-)